MVVGFKAKVKDIVNFLNAIRLEGVSETGSKEELYRDCIIYIAKQGLKIEAVDEHRISYERVKWLAKPEKNLYQLQTFDEGKIPIGNIKKVLSLLNSFNKKDDVRFLLKKNKLFIERKKPRKRVSITLTGEEYIKSKSIVEEKERHIKFDPANDERPEVTGNILDVKIVTKADDLKQLIKDAGKVEDRAFPVKVSKQKCSIMMGNDECFIETEIPAKIEIEDDNAKSLYRAGIGNIFGNISGEVNVYLKDNGFLWIESVDKNIRKDYMVTNAQED